MSKQETDWNKLKTQVLSRIQQGEPLSGKNGALTPLIKEVLETALSWELAEHLEKSKEESKKNRRNGKVGKKLKSDYGSIDLETSRDRRGSFEPVLVKKRQTTLGSALNAKILSLWGKGISYSDIREHIEDLYGMQVSEATISGITDTLIPKVKSWQNRPLEAIYPLVWLDALHFKVKQDGRIINKAVYCVLAANQHGVKELLGMYIGENESASFWLNILTELQNRGVQDMLIACIDNLAGFKEAIETIFPKTEIQQCVIHQVRNSMKYIVRKHEKEFREELKTIYQADTLQIAEQHLEGWTKKWKPHYPLVVKSWNQNWVELSAFFKYPKPIRRIIYTNNVIESLHSQIRKYTKTKRVFSSDMALMKLLYLIQQKVTQKWVMPMYDWKRTLAQFSIIFHDRINLDLKVKHDK